MGNVWFAVVSLYVKLQNLFSKTFEQSGLLLTVVVRPGTDLVHQRTEALRITSIFKLTTPILSRLSLRGLNADVIMHGWSSLLLVTEAAAWP
jgi:hypothetical protein